MLNTGTRILFLSLATLSVACSGTATGNQVPPAAEPSVSSTYANEYGQIELVEVNDSVMRTIFSDNEKVVFDTLMRIDHNFGLFPSDSFPFLALQGCGLKVYANRLQAYDFLGIAQMPMYTGIPEISDKAFYRVDAPVTISDEIVRQKGGILLDGIYLADGSEHVNEFVHLTGIIRKEKYPREYYSTPDGPQGMFPDTNQVHYRLVAHDYTIEPVEKYTYKGTAMTIDGQRALIWEMADSEAYFLDGENNGEGWPKELEGKTIEISAVLVQHENGKSLLKAWKILE